MSSSRFPTLAVEAAHTIHNQLKAAGKSSNDIKSVRIRTQEAAICIIDKQGPLCINHARGIDLGC